MSTDLTDSDLASLETTLREDRDTVLEDREVEQALTLISELRRRREAMRLLVPWVDHEEAGLPGPDTPCTDRCPACLLERANGHGYDALLADLKSLGDAPMPPELRVRVSAHVVHCPGQVFDEPMTPSPCPICSRASRPGV